MDQNNATQPILQLPAEILHHILQWITPADLVVLPRVCSAFNRVTKVNNKLYRDVYINTLVSGFAEFPVRQSLMNQDQPSDTELDYKKAVKDLVKLEAICNSKEVYNKVRQYNDYAIARHQMSYTDPSLENRARLCSRDSYSTPQKRFSVFIRRSRQR